MEHSMTRVGTLDKYYVPCEYVAVECGGSGGEANKNNQIEREIERERARKKREESENAKDRLI